MDIPGKDQHLAPGTLQRFAQGLEIGAPSDCLHSGQDAELARGRPWPQPRFEVEGELVTDRLTGLVWPLDARFWEFPLTWAEALDLISTINAEGRLGHRDWRLPNRRKLRSLSDHQTRRPSLPRDHPFQRVFASWYWSSTTSLYEPDWAWALYLDKGAVGVGQ